MLYCDVPVDSCSSNGGTFVLFVPAGKAVSPQVSDSALDAFMYVARTTLCIFKGICHKRTAVFRAASGVKLVFHICLCTLMMEQCPPAHLHKLLEAPGLQIYDGVSWVLNFHHVCR